MCYYNGVKVSRTEYIRLKNFEKAVADFDSLSTPLHIGFNYSNVPVLKRIEGELDFTLVQMEWGFLPSYIKTRDAAKRFREGYKKPNGEWQQPITTLNAMSEEMLLPGKMYRDSALNRRCLFLSTGFYEWRHIHPISKKTGKPLKIAEKYPYRIGLKESEIFYIAGFYTPWTDESTGEHIETCSMVTTEANDIMGQIHNSKFRMPTILTEELACRWLFDDLTEKEITQIGRYQFDSNKMEAYTVSKDFRTAEEPALPVEQLNVPALELAA